MNHEANVIYLRQMKNQIRDVRLKLAASPVQAHSLEFHKIIAQHGIWENKLKLIQRDLKTQSHHNTMLMRQNRFGTGAFAAHQRFGNKTANLATLGRAACEVAHELAHVMQQANGGSAGRRSLEALSHAIEQLMKTGDDGALQSLNFSQKEQVISASVRQLQQDFGVPPSSIPPGGIVDIFTLVLGCFVLLKAINDKPGRF